MAIDTGVEVFPVAVDRIEKNVLNVFFPHIHHPKRGSRHFGPAFELIAHVAPASEPDMDMQGGHVDPLIGDQFNGQHAVQTAAK